MTPDEAADLAARTLAAIDAAPGVVLDPERIAADRERVASDLAGLRESSGPMTVPEGHRGAARAEQERHAARYAAGLRRTAALYGVT